MFQPVKHIISYSKDRYNHRLKRISSLAKVAHQEAVPGGGGGQFNYPLREFRGVFRFLKSQVINPKAFMAMHTKSEYIFLPTLPTLNPETVLEHSSN